MQGANPYPISQIKEDNMAESEIYDDELEDMRIWHGEYINHYEQVKDDILTIKEC